MRSQFTDQFLGSDRVLETLLCYGQITLYTVSMGPLIIEPPNL